MKNKKHNKDYLSNGNKIFLNIFWAFMGLIFVMKSMI